MKKSSLKLMLFSFVLILGITISTSVFATNEKVQILKKSDNEYLIYISDHLDSSFEFAFSNDKNADKEELNYKVSTTDSKNTEDKNYIAYVDSNLYNNFFSKTTYLWARTIEGKYFAEGTEIDLENAITQEEASLADNVTKIIKVDTTNTSSKEETINDVKVTRTVGKVDVLEEGDTYYQLVNLPSTEEYNKLMEIAEQISENKVANNIYAKLEASKEFADLYNKLVPTAKSNKWIKVEGTEILQPEDSKEGEQYILWLKNENGKETKLDAQFLTCFEDYKPEVISEKIVTKLPVTGDNPVLFVVLAVLVIALIAICILKAISSKKTEK